MYFLPNDAYRQLLQRSAVASHRMPLEMRQHEQRVIVREVLSDVILFYHLAVRYRQLEIWPFPVEQVDAESVPSVLLERAQMLLRRVARSEICRVALDYRVPVRMRADLVDDRRPKIGTQEILISRLARVDLYRDSSVQLASDRAVKLRNTLRRYFVRKVYLRCHFIVLLFNDLK